VAEIQLRRKIMFGKVTAISVVEVRKDETLDSAVAKLLAITDGAEIARWVQFPRGVLLFVVVPGDPESGAFYVLDRKTGTWYWVDFEDEKYGGYSEADFECLLNAGRFARLIEQPQLLSLCRWKVTSEDGPELLGAVPRRSWRSEHKFNLTALRGSA
jgi:hypothetical protein